MAHTQLLRLVVGLTEEKRKGEERELGGDGDAWKDTRVHTQ